MKKKQPQKNEQYTDAKSKQGTSQKEISARFPVPNRGQNSSKSGNIKTNRPKGKAK